MTNRFKEAKRLAKITEVFAKHGLSYFWDKRKIKKEEKALKEPIGKKAKAKRLRSIFEELGPSFMKLGQMLSTRPDVVEKEYINELSQLRRKARRIPFKETKKVLEEEIGPVEKVFDDFDKEPIASASIGQVHKAIYKGKKVIVKVQRPAIREAVEADFRILKDFVGLFRRLMIEKIPTDPKELVEELENDIEKQLDYTIEARNCQIIQRNLKEMEGIKIPNIYWDVTTPKVLVQEYMEGEVLEDLIETGDIAKYNRELLAKNFSETYFKMILRDGFFHADPHPANIIVKNNVIALIDFGSAGRLTGELKKLSLAFYIAVLEGFTDLATEAVIELCEGKKEIDKTKLEWDLQYLTELVDLPLKISFTSQGLPDVLAKHGLKAPREFVLLEKSFDSMIGIAMDIYPDLVLKELLKPFVRNEFNKELGPENFINKILTKTIETEEALTEIPKSLGQISSKLAEGNLEIDLEHRGLNPLVKELDRATSRLSYSLIVAAIVIASSIVAVRDIGPIIYGVPLIGFFGFTLAFVMGLALLVSVIKYRKLF